MPKVGLITYHASHNMGSIMQTYAMDHLLSTQYGLDVDVLDFSSKGQRDLYSLFSKQGGLKGLIKNIIIVALLPLFRSRHKDFEGVIDAMYKKSSRKYRRTEDFEGALDSYDALVCGSDQIWNTNCSDFDDAYFFPYKSRAMKVAYAPSFGGKNFIESGVDLGKYKKFLSEFRCISAREANGVRWIKQLTGVSVPLVADPTLLIDKSVYDALVKPREFDGDYIFFYGIPFNRETYSKISRISKKYNLPVVMLDIKSWVFSGGFARGFKVSKRCTPGDYLSLIKNAKLVITTSFHGSIFSYIYSKNFWLLSHQGSNPHDDRLETLLTQLNLKDRRVFLDDVEDHDFLAPANFEKCDIRDLRLRSMIYLKDALNIEGKE